MDMPSSMPGSPVMTMPHQNPIMNRAKLGMLVFLSSEAIFFTLLILSYIYFGAKDSTGPGASDVLDISVTGLFTIALFSSSLTVWLAERAAKAQNQTGTVLWLIVTIILGAIFLGGQGMEYSKLFSENVTVARNDFGTTFFTVTGFHGLHVFIGLIMLIIAAGMAAAGAFKRSHGIPVEVISWYWHFVDIVWVFVFSTIYIPTLFK